MVILSQKLDALKLKMKDWNQTVYGDVDQNVQDIE